MSPGLLHGVLLLRGSLARPAPTARFVGQALDTLCLKPLHPLVDKTPVDPDRGRNVGDRSPIGDEEDNPGTSEQPETDGGRPLPREERLAFRWREGDGERGCASTSHTASFCETGVDGNNGRALHGMFFLEKLLRALLIFNKLRSLNCQRA
jgi:hypothetical protein